MPDNPDTQRPQPYEVSLPVFEGPLALLLHLIERQELDITAVSLALVTNQFLEYLALVPERDAASLADFLVVAARLILIKSRVLLPRPPLPAEPEEEPPGEDLVQQLIEYKKIHEAARWLRGIEESGLQSFVRLGGEAGAHAFVERTVDLDGISLDELLAAVRRVLDVKPAQPSVDGAVAPLRVTVAEQMERISQGLARASTLSFLALIEGAHSRLEVVVTLLALLEMVKLAQVRMHQESPFGDIVISPAR